MRSSIKYPVTDVSDERGALFLGECSRYLVKLVVETDFTNRYIGCISIFLWFPNMSGGAFAFFGVAAVCQLGM